MFSPSSLGKSDTVGTSEELSKLKTFFKAAAKEPSIEFFQAQDTSTAKSLKSAWIAYVKAVQDPRRQDTVDDKFKKIFEQKYLDLLRHEYQQWFLGSEQNFQAAKILKDYGLGQKEYNL